MRSWIDLLWMCQYKLPLLMQEEDEEEADDFGGVLRDVLSAFWDEYPDGDVEM